MHGMASLTVSFPSVRTGVAIDATSPAAFFLTAHFSPEDYPYDWLMHWLSKQPAWSKSREFEITTRSGGIKATSSSNTQDEDDEDLDSDNEDPEQEDIVHGRKKREVAFLPSIDTTHTIYYRGHWLRVRHHTFLSYDC